MRLSGLEPESTGYFEKQIKDLEASYSATELQALTIISEICINKVYETRLIGFEPTTTRLGT